MMFAVRRSPFAVGETCSHWTLQHSRRCNSLDKPCQHLLNVRRGMFQCLSLLWGEKSQVLRQQNKTNQLVGRASGYMQELSEFRVCCSSASLCDIAEDRSRGSSHLAGQAKSFGIRISSCRAINTQRQGLAPLPYFEFSEVLHVLTPFCTILKGATLAQEYCTKQVLTLCLALTANGKRQTANASCELPC